MRHGFTRRLDTVATISVLSVVLALLVLAGLVEGATRLVCAAVRASRVARDRAGSVVHRVPCVRVGVAGRGHLRVASAAPVDEAAFFERAEFSTFPVKR